MVDFDTNSMLLKAAGITVYAASVDGAEDTQSLHDGLRIGWVNMLHSVDAHAVANATGAHIQDGDRTFLHATGLLINPDGMISNAVYSTGPIGRFTCNDILKKVEFEKMMRAKA